MRTILVDTVDYVASYHEEDLGDAKMVMFHCDVYYWAPSVLKMMLQQWALFREAMKCPIFCMGTVDDAKFARLVSLFGFQHLSDIPCTDGETRKLFVSYP
jgi:hypothetical protein